MVELTDTAITKVNEILGQQEPKPEGLRISGVGGGCSGVVPPGSHARKHGTALGPFGAEHPARAWLEKAGVLEPIG